MTDNNKEKDESANPPASPPPTPKGKDTWDKIDIITKPLFAILTASTIALISYYGQSTIRELSSQEQDARLYTELLSRREDAESALRKDMFKEVMSGFFTDVDQGDIENSLSKKTLKLEMLSLNFGDSLSLGPLFKEMSNDIERVLEHNKETFIDWQNVAARYQKRLRSLAKRVASAQLSTIYPRGKDLGLSEVKTEMVLPPEDKNLEQNWMVTINDIAGDNPKEIELEGVRRIFELHFRNADLKNQSIQVLLNIFEFKEVETDGSEPMLLPQKVADLEFTLDFFNFPLIDNTRLSNNQRFALVLEKFDINSITVRGVVFPGLYASQRDKPFLNEAIQELKNQQYRLDDLDTTDSEGAEK